LLCHKNSTIQILPILPDVQQKINKGSKSPLDNFKNNGAVVKSIWWFFASFPWG